MTGKEFDLKNSFFWFELTMFIFSIIVIFWGYFAAKNENKTYTYIYIIISIVADSVKLGRVVHQIIFGKDWKYGIYDWRVEKTYII